MNRRNLVLAAVALVSLLAGVLLHGYLQPQPGPPPGIAPPSIELRAIPLVDLQQRQTVVEDWLGELLVVNFWAPWCAPCRREIPTLIEVQRDYAEMGVKVLGIAFDNAAQVERFAADYQIDYPLFLAQNRSGMYNIAFGNPSGSLPFTALLDRNLRIAFRHNGEITRARLRDELEKALKTVD